MKICLIASEFYPSYGGIGRTFTYMCKAFRDKKDILLVLNSVYRGKNIFDVLDSTKINNLSDLIVLFKNRTHIFYLILSVWKILTANHIKFYSRLNMLLYLFIKPRILIKLMRNLSTVHPMLKKIKPDLIFGSTCGKTELTLGFILSRLIGRKFICSGHGTDFLVRSHYSLKTHYLQAVDKIIVHTDRLKDLIKKINHLEDERLLVIPPGLYLQNYTVDQEKNEIRKDLNIGSEDFVLISIGRHVPRKNFQIVIKAIKVIKEKYPHLKIKYLLIGKGEETKKLKNICRNFNLDSDIRFLGAINDKLKNRYLKASDVFIMPSITLRNSIEGFGLVFLEANFYKLPVIGTLTGGISEVIENNKSGLLIDPNDLKGLINAIIYLCDHENKRKKMGNYGHARVIEKYNWDVLVDEYIRVFKMFL